MNRLASTILMTAVLMGIGAAYAASPAEMYDDVWKIVNKKYINYKIILNFEVLIN